MMALVGQIQLFPFAFVPAGWLPCDGQLLAAEAYPALFALLGMRFGGDGVATFALPDLRGRAPALNMAYFIALYGALPKPESPAA